jgi:hypothetical protein
MAITFHKPIGDILIELAVGASTTINACDLVMFDYSANKATRLVLPLAAGDFLVGPAERSVATVATGMNSADDVLVRLTGEFHAPIVGVLTTTKIGTPVYATAYATYTLTRGTKAIPAIFVGTISRNATSNGYAFIKFISPMLFSKMFESSTDSYLTTGAADVIDTTNDITFLTTGGAHALTLANGVYAGQKKTIIMVGDGGDGTLALTGFTSIVFNDVHDVVELVWSGTAWNIVSVSGCTVTP